MKECSSTEGERVSEKSGGNYTGSNVNKEGRHDCRNRGRRGEYDNVSSCYRITNAFYQQAYLGNRGCACA